MNVQEPIAPVRVSVGDAAKMTFYVSGPGTVRAMLPIDIEVLALRHLREQLGMTTNGPAQNGVYMNGQAIQSGVSVMNPFGWNRRPFPVLAPQNRPEQVAPFPYYNYNGGGNGNGNIPSRVGKNITFDICSKGI